MELEVFSQARRIRILTNTLRILPLLGLAFIPLGAGWTASLPESWWDKKGFIVNLASGLTAASFGVPLAFFVLQGLLSRQERYSRKHQTLSLARATALDIRHELDHLLNDINAWTTKRRKVASLVEQLSEEMSKSPRDSLALRSVIARLVSHLPAGSKVTEEVLRGELVAAVNFLSGELRFRLAEENLEPIPPWLIGAVRTFVEHSPVAPPQHRLAEAIEASGLQREAVGEGPFQADGLEESVSRFLELIEEKGLDARVNTDTASAEAALVAADEILNALVLQP